MERYTCGYHFCPVIAGTVNTVWDNENRAGTYAMMGMSDAAANVALARQIFALNVRRSAINIMNISSTATPIEVRYYNTAGAQAFGPVGATLQPNQAIGYNTNTISGFPNPFEGSAIVTAPAGSKLIAIGNLIYTSADANGGDRAAVYEGVGF